LYFRNLDAKHFRRKLRSSHSAKRRTEPSPNQKRSRQAAFSRTRIHAQPQPNKRKQTNREYRGIHLDQCQGKIYGQPQMIHQEAEQKLKQH
jgi:hypothetical protein